MEDLYFNAIAPADSETTRMQLLYRIDALGVCDRACPSLVEVGHLSKFNIISTLV